MFLDMKIVQKHAQGVFWESCVFLEGDPTWEQFRSHHNFEEG